MGIERGSWPTHGPSHTLWPTHEANWICTKLTKIHIFFKFFKFNYRVCRETLVFGPKHRGYTDLAHKASRARESRIKKLTSARNTYGRAVPTVQCAQTHVDLRSARRDVSRINM